MPDAIPDTPAEAERQLAEDHVAEIMFDAGATPERDCHLCTVAVALGVWQHYGVADPFAPDPYAD